MSRAKFHARLINDIQREAAGERHIVRNVCVSRRYLILYERFCARPESGRHASIAYEREGILYYLPGYYNDSGISWVFIAASLAVAFVEAN